MTRVAIVQPNYLPWKGYFDLIHDVDVFLHYDDVQYTVRDWRNRNRIKTAQRSAWLTIPVGADRNRLIRDVEVPGFAWQASHWESMRHAYAKAPYFQMFRDYFEWFFLGNTWTNLSELNRHLVEHIAREWLGVKTSFGLASDFGVTSAKQERIVDLLRATNADLYVSGPSARAYLDESKFREEGIELVWKDYTGYPEYPQFHPPFEHEVSIVDLLFQTGDNAPWYIWGWRENGAPPAQIA